MQTNVGHYRVIEPIGSGGMGTVYRARDERLERDVALKVLTSTRPIDDDARRRFRREALSLSKLNHPNVATIHDFETFDDLDVLVMEHIPGRDLTELVREGPLPEPEVIRLGQQLLSALEAAHERDVIHRDLKPGNIRLTTDGRLKVLDFGLAQVRQTGSDATTASLSTAGFAGTVPYMAPEQVHGGILDARTDIYGAGAVLYEMATGTHVHPGLSGARLLGAILEEPPLSARSLNPRVSADLEQVLRKALDKDPALRYQSAREMRVDLDRLAAPSKSTGDRPLRWRRKRTLAFAALALLAAVGWYAWSHENPFPGRILVADFEDNTNDPEIALTIRELFTLQLQQSRPLKVMSRDQVVEALRRMGLGEGAALDARTAAELAEREGIPLVLAGTLHRRGEQVVIAVSGIDAATRTPVFTVQKEYTDAGDMGAHLSSLASAVRRQLGESLKGVTLDTEPLDQVTTPSIEAVKLYSRGAEAVRRGDSDVALNLLRAAIVIDPEFAMAHRMIARAYETSGNRAQERAHLERAYELRERLTTRERLQVEASYFKGRGEYERAVGVLTAAINLFPADGEARYELALARRDAGQSARAIELLEELLVSDPSFTVAYGVLALELERSGQYDRARAAHAEARARNASSPMLSWAHGLILLGDGDIDEARAQFRELGASSNAHAGVARLLLATADIIEGRLGEATERLQADILTDRRLGEFAAEARRRFLLGQILLLRGEREAAAAQPKAILAAGPNQHGPNDWLIAGTLLAWLGDVSGATGLLRELDRMRTPAPSGFVESCYQNLAGEIALAQGRPRDAVQAFTSAANHYPRTVTTHGLARAYTAMQDWQRAREHWTLIMDSRGRFLHEGLAADWVLSHLQRARASRALGDAQGARSDYERFLQLWGGGDDLPEVRAAAAERRALGDQ